MFSFDLVNKLISAAGTNNSSTLMFAPIEFQCPEVAQCRKKSVVEIVVRVINSETRIKCCLYLFEQLYWPILLNTTLHLQNDVRIDMFHRGHRSAVALLLRDVFLLSQTIRFWLGPECICTSGNLSNYFTKTIERIQRN